MIGTIAQWSLAVTGGWLMRGWYERFKREHSKRKTAAILRALEDRPGYRLYADELAVAAGYLPGSIYPELAALEMRGVVKSDWEETREPGTQVRRQYWLADKR